MRLQLKGDMIMCGMDENKNVNKKENNFHKKKMHLIFY
jgi:hypothetical protein